MPYQTWYSSAEVSCRRAVIISRAGLSPGSGSVRSHMSNFRESAELILSCGGGVQVYDGIELAAVLARLLDDPAERQVMGENGAGLLEKNSGSTGSIWRLWNVF